MHESITGDIILNTTERFSEIVSSDNTTNDVTPNPFRVCACKDQNIYTRNCKEIEETTGIRGKEFTVQAAIFSRQNSFIPNSYIRVILENDVEIDPLNVYKRQVKIALKYAFAFSVNITQQQSNFFLQIPLVEEMK